MSSQRMMETMLSARSGGKLTAREPLDKSGTFAGSSSSSSSSKKVKPKGPSSARSDTSVLPNPWEDAQMTHQVCVMD